MSDGLYAIGAGTARSWLRASPCLLAGERYVAGSVYIGLGLAAALKVYERLSGIDVSAAASPSCPQD